MKLNLEVWSDAGKSHLATLEERDLPYRIGRDLTCDIPVPSQALSRQHGEFFGFDTGWIYRDLNSTNGSWLNGEKVAGGQLTVLRQGDTLQVADLTVRTLYEKEQNPNPESDRYGFRIFVVREGKEFLELNPKNFDGTIVTEFDVSFELKEDSFFVVLESSDAEVCLNQEQISESKSLECNDYLKVKDVEFLIVNGMLGAPVRASTKSNVAVPERVRVNLDLTATGNEPPNAAVFSPARTTLIDPASVKRFRFGDAVDSEDTGGEDDNYVSRVRGPGFEGTFDDESSWFDFNSLSDSEKAVVIGIVFFIVASLMLLVLWFFLVR